MADITALASSASTLLPTSVSTVLQSLLPTPPAPQVQYVQAPAKTNWLLWGGIAAAAVGVLVLIKMRRGRSASTAAPVATNPRRRRRSRRR